MVCRVLETLEIDEEGAGEHGLRLERATAPEGA
jgi:hypothetical protein